MYRLAVILSLTLSLTGKGFCSEIANYADSVVRIVVSLKGKDNLGTGSGFIIDDSGHIITNEHVISDADKVIIFIKQGKTAKPYPVDIIDYDRAQDLALLKSSKIISDPLIFQTRNFPEGSEVYAIGFPSAADGILDISKYYNDLNLAIPTVTKGVISRILSSKKNIKSNDNLIQHSSIISFGNSGGPLLNPCGHVLGVNTFSAISEANPDINESGFGYAIESNTVLDFLNRNGIYPSVTKSSCLSSLTNSNVSGNINNQNNSTTYLIVILLASSLLLSAYIFTRQKNLSFNSSDFVEEKIHKNKWILEFDGRHYELGENLTPNNPFIVGRGQDSSLIISDNRVSRHHLKIFFMSGDIYAQDMNSSNGTVINGDKLGYAPVGISKYSVISLGRKIIKIQSL